MLRRPATLVAALFAAAFIGAAPVALAQARAEPDSGAAVQVSAVRFKQARVDGQQNPWLEAEVEVQSRGRDAKAPGNSRYIDFVRVELMLAYELKGEGNRGFSYYRASQTAISIDAGRSLFRFYLPQEILKRDSLPSTEPTYWLATVSAEGQELPSNPRAASTRFESPSMIQSFRQRVASEGAANDGILVPHYDSPFANQNLRDVPSMLRKPVR